MKIMILSYFFIIKNQENLYLIYLDSVFCNLINVFIIISFNYKKLILYKVDNNVGKMTINVHSSATLVI